MSGFGTLGFGRFADNRAMARFMCRDLFQKETFTVIREGETRGTPK